MSASSRLAREPPHLTGRVADVAFRGRGYEYAIDLPGLGRLTGVFAPHRAGRGAEVGLRLDPDGCHLFPATQDRPEGVSPFPGRGGRSNRLVAAKPRLISTIV